MRAFGPRAAVARPPHSAAKAFALARELGLASRIGARHSHAVLLDELGEPIAAELSRSRVEVAALEALLRQAVTEVVQAGHALGAPCVLLKFAALNRLGVARPGSRGATDIDVLVPRPLVKSLEVELFSRGYRPDTTVSASAHQRQGIITPEGVLLELHLHVPGLRLAHSADYVGAEDLMFAGLVVRSGGAWVPTSAVLVAHAILHGFSQHARAPHMHSPLRTFADLIDLVDHDPASFDLAGALLGHSLLPRDVTDILDDARSLAAGEAHGTMPSRRALRHAIASQLDSSYARQLRLRVFTQPGPGSVHLTPKRLISLLGEVVGLGTTEAALLCATSRQERSSRLSARGRDK